MIKQEPKFKIGDTAYHVYLSKLSENNFRSAFYSIKVEAIDYNCDGELVYGERLDCLKGVVCDKYGWLFLTGDELFKTEEEAARFLIDRSKDFVKKIKKQIKDKRKKLNDFNESIKKTLFNITGEE